MRTIALRFSDGFAPPDGTIAEHIKMIERNGYVWYGKLGNNVSENVCRDLLNCEDSRILLIHSGKVDRYWAFIDKISKEIPELDGIPKYYREMSDKFKSWFRIIKIVEAEKNVLLKCKVVSSGKVLSQVSRHSMSPYFIIDYNE